MKSDEPWLPGVDPALCCSTGACGPDVCVASAANPRVQRALQTGRATFLPVVLWAGKVVAPGPSPDRATLAQVVALIPSGLEPAP